MSGEKKLCKCFEEKVLIGIPPFMTGKKSPYVRIGWTEIFLHWFKFFKIFRQMRGQELQGIAYLLSSGMLLRHTEDSCEKHG